MLSIMALADRTADAIIADTTSSTFQALNQ
jgi:hypothetical protein